MILEILKCKSTIYLITYLIVKMNEWRYRAFLGFGLSNSLMNVDHRGADKESLAVDASIDHFVELHIKVHTSEITAIRLSLEVPQMGYAVVEGLSGAVRVPAPGVGVGREFVGLMAHRFLRNIKIAPTDHP